MKHRVHLGDMNHFAAIAAFAVLAGSCSDAGIVNKNRNRPGENGAASGAPAPGRNADGTSGSTPSGGAAPMAPPLTMPPDPSQAPPPPPQVPETCAEDARQAQRLPLDMLVLVDRSRSMSENVEGGGQGTKWELLRQAILTFTRDPASEGFGIGLQAFPALRNELTCSANADCASQTCLGESVCVGATAPDGGIPEDEQGPKACDDDDDCKYGAKCEPRGRCSKTGRICPDIGDECDFGMDDDMCTQLPRTCLDDTVSCNVDDYANLLFPVEELRDAADGLAQRMMLIDPRSDDANGAGTPLGPAIEGALAHLRGRVEQFPNRRAVMVLASDAEPSRCQPRAIGTLANRLEAASQADPRIATFVIGVLGERDGRSNRNALNRLAEAGGTMTPFIATTDQNFGAMFLQALEQIRGAALPCEFAIPSDRAESIDFGKVNLRFRPMSMGSEEDLFYVGSADKCDPMRGGWYYDVDPATGASPTAVVVCPSTCERFKANDEASVDLTFGCKTREIQ